MEEAWNDITPAERAIISHRRILRIMATEMKKEQGHCRLEEDTDQWRFELVIKKHPMGIY